MKDIKESAGPLNLDENYVNTVMDYFKYLKTTYPNDLGILADVAVYEKKMGFAKDFQESKDSAEKNPTGDYTVAYRFQIKFNRNYKKFSD